MFGGIPTAFVCKFSVRAFCGAAHADAVRSGPLNICRPTRPTSRYNGVSWNHGRWLVRATSHGEVKYVGRFDNSFDAARAHDDALRCQGIPTSALKRLNFPTPDELKRLEEVTPEERRQEALRLHGDDFAKEAAAKRLIQAHIHACGHDIHWLPEGTLADGIFRLGAKSAVDSWMGIQVKSTLGPKNGSHKFNGTLGYSNLLLLLVSLNEPRLWIMPGSIVTVKCVGVTACGKWSTHSTVWEDMVVRMERAWHQHELFLLQPARQWETPRSKNHRFGLCGYQLAQQVLEQAGLFVEKPLVEHGPVDMYIERNIAVQVKSRTMRPCGTVSISLHRSGGSCGYRPYAHDDFHALLVVVLQNSKLTALFVLPMWDLLQRGYTGFDAQSKALTVYLPSSRLSRKSSTQRQAWQAQYFFGPEGDATPSDLSRLRRLVMSCRPAELSP